MRLMSAQIWGSGWKQVSEFVLAYGEQKNFRAKTSCCRQHTWCSDSPSRTGKLNVPQRERFSLWKNGLLLYGERWPGWFRSRAGDENRASSFSQQDRCTNILLITVFHGKQLRVVSLESGLQVYLLTTTILKNLADDVSLSWKHQINPTSLNWHFKRQSSERDLVSSTRVSNTTKEKQTEWRVRHLLCSSHRHHNGYLSMLNALFLFIGKRDPRDPEPLQFTRGRKTLMNLDVYVITCIMHLQ